MSFESDLIWLIFALLGLTLLGIALMLLPLAYKRLDNLVLLFVALTPLHTLVRSIRVDSVLLSGWRDIIYVGICAIWLLGVLRGRFQIKANPMIQVVLLFNLIGMIQAMRANSFIVGIAGFRDIIKYSLLAVVTYSLCREQPFFLRKIVKTIFAVGICVAVLQFVFYFLDLDYVLRLGTIEPSYRSLGPFYLRRMEAFFGGAPSNLGIYLGTPLTIYLTLHQLGQKLPKWWHIGAWLLLVGMMMTLSFTAVIAVGLVYMVLLLQRGGNIAFKLAVMTVLVIIFLGLNAGFDRAVVGDQEATTFLSYLINIFFKGLFLGNLSTLVQDPLTLIWGHGLALVGAKSFLDTANQANVMIIGSSDGGWVEFAIQVGVPMTILIFVAIIATSWRALQRSSMLPTPLRVNAFALFVALVIMLSSLHIIPWTRVGPDVNFWLVLGALASVPTLASRVGLMRYIRNRTDIGSCSITSSR